MWTIFWGIIALIVIGSVLFILAGIAVTLANTAANIIYSVFCGIISLFNLIFNNPILIILLLVGLYFFDSPIGWLICFALYALFTIMLIQLEGRQEVQRTIQDLIKMHGIMPAHVLEQIKPVENKFKIFHKSFYVDSASKEYLTEEVKEGRICKDILIDEKSYYYLESNFRQFTSSLRKNVFSEAKKLMNENKGIVQGTRLKTHVAERLTKIYENSYQKNLIVPYMNKFLDEESKANSIYEDIFIDEKSHFYYHFKYALNNFINSLRKQVLAEYDGLLKANKGIMQVAELKNDVLKKLTDIEIEDHKDLAELYIDEFLNEEVKAGKVLEGNLADQKFYYYWEDSLRQFIKSIKESVFRESSARLISYGIIYSKHLNEMIDKLTAQSTHQELIKIYCRNAFSTLMKYLVENNRVLNIQNVYIMPNTLNAKWEKLKNTLIISQETFCEYFGSHDFQWQEIIMNFVLENDSSFKYTYDENTAMWVEENYKKSHTCFKCNKFFYPLEKYGPHSYCQSCLKGIHSDEEAALERGESVKKYVSAPPKRARIKRIE